MSLRAILFDAYGTLFDVYAIAAEAERQFPGKGAELASLWRDKQIEYTRLRTLSNTYQSFQAVTRDALHFACNKLGLALDQQIQTQLMTQYNRLTPFPENLNVLNELKRKGIALAILSNGNPEMLAPVVKAAGMESVFDHVISAHTVKKFKTAPEVYQLGLDRLGIAAKDSLFVSSNGWDICGAAWFGYPTFWVNRSAAPSEVLGVTPDGEGRSLNDLLLFVRQHQE
ncbi:MAG: haloacid dehalogenase type II [Burkholderiaceae bacterium]